MAIFYSLTFNLLASQLFGIKPCQVYLSLDIKQFVQKFKPILKVAEEDLPSYERHVAILVYYIALFNLFRVMKFFIPL